ncbi:hypothetical protein ACSSS7_006180 [Eimeria intestinalis]
MAAASDEGGLDRFARALQELKKDVDFLYNPKELPKPDTANGRYPPGTGPVSRPIRCSSRGRPEADQPQPPDKSERQGANAASQQKALLKNGDRRQGKTGGGTHLSPAPVARLPRSPRAASTREAFGAGGGRAHLRRDTFKETSHGEEGEEGEASSTNPQVSRFTGATVRVPPSVDQAVAAGGLAVTASALKSGNESPVHYNVTVGDALSLSDESFSSASLSPREQQQQQQQHHQQQDDSGRNKSEKISRERRDGRPGKLDYLEAGGSPLDYKQCQVERGDIATAGALDTFRQGPHYPSPSRFGQQQQQPKQQQQQQQGVYDQRDFPPPHSFTEMQRRLEEEWAERERRLKLQHQRHTEAVVAQEVEKVTQEYGRRLIFELQQQEQILQTQFQQQNMHGQLREATDANWRLQQKAAELQQQLDLAEHRQKAAEADAQLLQQESENNESRLQHLKAENVFLSSQVAALERQAIGLKNKEEDLQRRLQIATGNLEKVQEQLQHEQQLSATYAQRRQGLEKEVDSLEHTKQQLQRQVQAASSDSLRYQGQAQNLAVQNAQIIHENDALKRKVQHLDLKIQEQLNVENDMLSKDRKIEDLQEELDVQQKKNADVMTALRMRVQHLERFEWLYSTLKTEVENLKLETQRLRDENATLLAEARQRGQQNNSSQVETRALQNELLQAQRENHLLRKDVQKLLKAVSSDTIPAGLSTTSQFRDYHSNRTSPENTLVLGGSAEKGDCLLDRSIPPSQFADALVLRGPPTYSYTNDQAAGFRQDALLNNPVERSTCPPPLNPTASNPLTHVHTPSVLVRAAGGAAACNGNMSAIPQPRGVMTHQHDDTQLIIPQGADYAEQMKSLDKQVLLLTADKKQLEAQLAKYPATSGTGHASPPTSTGTWFSGV